MSEGKSRVHWQDLLDCLRSPCCRASFDVVAKGVVCQACGATYREEDGILVLLKNQAEPKE